MRRRPAPREFARGCGRCVGDRARLPSCSTLSARSRHNGEAVGLRIQRSAQGPVDLCLRIEDVQHLVGILLALSCEAKRRQPPDRIDAPPSSGDPAAGERDQCRPDRRRPDLPDAGSRDHVADVRAAAGDADRGRTDAARAERPRHRSRRSDFVPSHQPSRTPRIRHPGRARDGPSFQGCDCVRQRCIVIGYNVWK